MIPTLDCRGDCYGFVMRTSAPVYSAGRQLTFALSRRLHPDWPSSSSLLVGWFDGGILMAEPCEGGVCDALVIAKARSTARR
jgi:hypothetical protein